MSNKSIEKEHLDIKEKISEENVLQIESAPDPSAAVDLLASHESMHVCAIIDKMSKIGAALVFGEIKLRAADTTDKYNTDFYKHIVERCESLNLEAIKGCVHARNETAHSTGIFLP
jgi:hypothetical protein